MLINKHYADAKIGSSSNIKSQKMDILKTNLKTNLLLTNPEKTQEVNHSNLVIKETGKIITNIIYLK